ncbi:MAG: histidine kinase [Gloeobacteraceae cyanobacterium ES-bin-316]|nr:histidine kinase [Ferruginibacter sp.]
MKLIKPPRLELISFLYSMPLIGVVLNLIMYKQKFWTDKNVWLVSFPLIFAIGILSWYGHVLYANAIETRYPTIHQSRQRIFWKAMVNIFVMSPSVLFIFFVYDYFQVLGYEMQRIDLAKGLFVGLSVNLVFDTLYEADYAFNRYKEAVAEKETLQELSLQEEFNVLKNQVNPHFLFNCFNTLSSLISVDKLRAEQFLNELSKVYRYLLRNNEDGLSTVENEVKFIESYYELLQTRHGDAVQLNIEIDKRYSSYVLPSLSLQLLIENVVKHNVLSKAMPLSIDIFTTAGNKMVVNNNLQRRTAKAPSNKVGLENIRAKYDLLKQPGFRVIEDAKNFTVILPLIWFNATENKKPESRRQSYS